MNMSSDQNSENQRSILYCAPGSILDITSGAAMSIRTMLAGLAANGFRTVALQASIFDSPQGAEHLAKATEAQAKAPVWRTLSQGIEHLIVNVASTHRNEMTCREEDRYFGIFMHEIKTRKPGVILLWGGMVLERAIMREARDAGIPVIFYLVNPGYRDKSVFKDVSMVITDSQATADLYRTRFGIHCTVLGKFIDKAAVLAAEPRSPEFITFINPSFNKGVSVFMPLARLAARECPEIKFLVVQSRGRWQQALEKLTFNADDFPNVRVIKQQTDMRPVYAKTKGLLVPSLWHESGARVIVEAQLNGIPVLASNTGGSGEMIGAGGKLFELPAIAREKMNEVHVTDEHLRPWLEEIKRLWHDGSYYADVCRGVEQDALKHDLKQSVTSLITALNDLTATGQRSVLPAS